MMMSQTQQQVQLTALQLTSSPDPQDNLQQIERLLQQLPAHRPQLVVLPEACLCFGTNDKRQRALAELPGVGPLQQALADLAKRHQIWLVAGTMPMIDERDARSEEHTSELQSRENLVCRLLLEKKKK